MHVARQESKYSHGLLLPLVNVVGASSVDIVWFRLYYGSADHLPQRLFHGKVS